MAEFEVLVYKIKTEIHPNADAIELAKIGDYLSIVRKDIFKNDDLVAYIPPQSIVPDRVIDELGLTGRLAGSKHNRVKEIRLRGILSEGLIYPAKPEWVEGQDVTKELGITKWEPKIPVNLSGEMLNHGLSCTVPFDVQNIKKYPDILIEGEEVEITEKIHGTFCMFGIVPEVHQHPQLFNEEFIITSKGLGSRGLFFQDNEKNKNNAYVKVAKKFDIYNKMKENYIVKKYIDKQPFFILGEVYGNVQDLKYGETLGFRMFDIVIGFKGKQFYVNTVDMDNISSLTGIEKVPVLYKGPYSKEKVLELTNGKEMVSGKEKHIREGIVIKPTVNRYDSKIGRVILKSVSEKYLMRKGGSEFN